VATRVSFRSIVIVLSVYTLIKLDPATTMPVNRAMNNSLIGVTRLKIPRQGVARETLIAAAVSYEEC